MVGRSKCLYIYKCYPYHTFCICSSAGSSLPTYGKSNKENSEVPTDSELYTVVGGSVCMVLTSTMLLSAGLSCTLCLSV